MSKVTIDNVTDVVVASLGQNARSPSVSAKS